MKAFEKNIRKVEPYVPGEQPQRKVIKLNTNENPYAPAPGVTKALEEMNTDRLRLYPDHKLNKDDFHKVREYYRQVYNQIDYKKARFNIKQIVRIVLLRYFPGIHSKLY